MELVVGCARIALGGVMLLAGISKAKDLARFEDAVGSFGFVPESLRGPLSKSVPTLEIALGAILLSGLAYRAASIVATAMLAAFTVALGVRIRRGGEAPCACFGSLFESRVGPSHILRNAVLIGISALVFFEGPGVLAVGNLR